VCSLAHGYAFTPGKEYVVHGYEPEDSTTCPTYTFPAYVHVTDDFARYVWAHAYRFVKKP
jgi:hypothetical protein